MPSKPRTITLCLIRCGETAWENDARLHGTTDLPLSESSRAQLAGAVKHLRSGHVAMVHHPPDEAATETAHLVARKLHARAKAEAELADPNLGLLEGMRVQEFAERQPSRHRQWEDDPMTLEPPEGEPFAVAATRIFHAVTRVLKRSRSPEIAMVLHPLALGMLRCWLGDRRSTDLWLMLKDRPRIERYAMTIDMVDELEGAALSVAGPS